MKTPPLVKLETERGGGGGGSSKAKWGLIYLDLYLMESVKRNVDDNGLVLFIPSYRYDRHALWLMYSRDLGIFINGRQGLCRSAKHLSRTSLSKACDPNPKITRIVIYLHSSKMEINMGTLRTKGPCKSLRNDSWIHPV